MTKQHKTVSVCLPFAGFYESKWSGMIEEEERRFIENAKQEPDDEFHDIAKHDEGAELFELLFKHTNYSVAYGAIAREYADNFGEYFTRETGFELQTSFEEMTSPRFYNFETDRVFALVPIAYLYLIYRKLRAEYRGELARTIHSRHSSRSGFHSFYSNNIEEWEDKPFSTWDHNEYETLLLAAMASQGVDADQLEWSIYEDWADSGYREWEQAVDWPALEAAVQA
jgi:hypothetical protein